MRFDNYQGEKLAQICVDETTNFVTAMQTMNEFGLRALPVKNQSGAFVGVIADGDIRRWLSQHSDLKAPISNAVKRDAKHLVGDVDPGSVLRRARELQVDALPVLEDGKLTNYFVFWPYSNLTDVTAVIMAGGLGSRLAPLTDHCPKPMLQLGNKPILLHLVEELSRQGIRKFVFSLNYLAEQIVEFFGDGSKFGVEIHYVQETKRLGTGGALSLIEPSWLSDNFICLNGDVLNDVDYDGLLEQHIAKDWAGTMVTRSFTYQMPYGSVEYNGNNEYIRSVEKPTTVYKINAGIYCLSKSVLDFVPKDDFFDMPSLFEQLAHAGRTCGLYTHNGHWMDIGTISELERAQGIFEGSTNA